MTQQEYNLARLEAAEGLRPYPDPKNIDQPKSKIRCGEPATGELEARITDYLVAGGLFNPELMEHDKVRDLLMDCRDALTQPKPTTGEWTVGDELLIYSGIDLVQRGKIVDAHNAAIAAEREKVQTLMDALKEVNALARGNMTGCGTCNHVIDVTIKVL